MAKTAKRVKAKKTAAKTAKAAKKSAAKVTSVIKRCGHCRKRGHNVRTCPTL